MRLSLIGMSNIGKTYFARHLAATKGFAHINCDAMIEENLAPELAKDGPSGTLGMAKWVGFPYEPHYEKHSSLYTQFECDVMRNILAGLHKEENSSALIDTTGSVIYCDDEILDALREKTKVIYFEASESHIDALFKNYIAHPKPVIWGKNYHQRADETPEQALRRCYPELLLYRIERYKKLAAITIPYEQHRNRKTEIWDLIQKQLTQT